MPHNLRLHQISKRSCGTRAGQLTAAARDGEGCRRRRRTEAAAPAARVPRPRAHPRRPASPGVPTTLWIVRPPRLSLFSPVLLLLIHRALHPQEPQGG
ncbi:hypothetical protein EJB05_12601 [Eragrostis curvula]|uniref:Uncharacterized protein n=1 Tax=Eragrostis curvula TaxID=38414 RepID=A0A5J9VUW1_9POAL|nr:hypothetical protein EJB05_12601 [Eragrostis curvula]